MRTELRRYAVVNARGRTLLASLLGRRGLEALYGYPSAEAILKALAGTAYAATVGPEPAVTERGLLARLAHVGRATLAVLADPEAAFLHHYLLWHEVANLQIVVRAVHRRYPWPEVARHTVALPGLATVDPEALAGAADLGELVDRLAGTRYEPALRAALPQVVDLGPFALEVALELQHYEALWARAATLRPSDAAHARRLLGALLDVLNLSWIARYRGVLGLSPEEALAHTVPHGRWLTAATREALARDPSRSSWAAVLARTPYAAVFAATDAGSFEEAAPGLWRVLATEVQRSLTAYPFHVGVPLGLLMAQEIEIRDLHMLLAAKSLGVAAGAALANLATARG